MKRKWKYLYFLIPIIILAVVLVIGIRNERSGYRKVNGGYLYRFKTEDYKTVYTEQFQEERDEKIEEIEYLNANTELSRNDVIDHLYRKFLKENEMESFVNAIEMKFKNNRFFAASAIGHTRDAGAYNPVGVLEPMAWICTKADKKLASLWVKGKYSKKPIENLIDKLEV